MLSDAQRKLFTVLYNYFSQHRVMPSFGVLKQFTRKDQAEAITILNELSELGYIEWNGKDVQTILILQYINSVPKKTPNSNTDYFTDH